MALSPFLLVHIRSGIVPTSGSSTMASTNQPPKTTLLAALMSVVDGSPAEKLDLFRLLKAARMLALEDPAEVSRVEQALRRRAALKSESDRP
jgi:hypothetical protein